MIFSTGFIQKKMLAHRSTFRQVLLSLSLVAQMKRPPISPADIINCTVTSLHTQNLAFCRFISQFHKFPGLTQQ
jgi:hypothetical protein